jgi:hypothetical protein
MRQQGQVMQATMDALEVLNSALREAADLVSHCQSLARRRCSSARAGRTSSFAVALPHVAWDGRAALRRCRTSPLDYSLRGGHDRLAPSLLS